MITQLQALLAATALHFVGWNLKKKPNFVSVPKSLTAMRFFPRVPNATLAEAMRQVQALIQNVQPLLRAANSLTHRTFILGATGNWTLMTNAPSSADLANALCSLADGPYFYPRNPQAEGYRRDPGIAGTGCSRTASGPGRCGLGRTGAKGYELRQFEAVFKKASERGGQRWQRLGPTGCVAACCRRWTCLNRHR